MAGGVLDVATAIDPIGATRSVEAWVDAYTTQSISPLKRLTDEVISETQSPGLHMLKTVTELRRALYRNLGVPDPFEDFGGFLDHLRSEFGKLGGAGCGDE